MSAIWQMRARYGTGDHLKLNKRKCSISIELVPCGADFLKVVLSIGNDSHTFWASSVMGNQFSSFVGAVYQLYTEKYDTHSHNRGIDSKAKHICPQEDPSLLNDEEKVMSHVCWDGEGVLFHITFTRKRIFCGDRVSDEEDLIEIGIGNPDDHQDTYTVDGRDLCYAVAKAYTEAIKKYGFYGYYSSTGGNCNGFGDVIDIHMILFIKAYALGAMDARRLETVWKKENSWMRAEGTSFDKELELLLFDL